MLVRSGLLAEFLVSSCNVQVTLGNQHFLVLIDRIQLNLRQLSASVHLVHRGHSFQVLPMRRALEWNLFCFSASLVGLCLCQPTFRLRMGKLFTLLDGEVWTVPVFLRNLVFNAKCLDLFR